MALLKRKPSDGGPKAPFKQRFLAWWEGVELPPSDDKPTGEEGSRARTAAAADQAGAVGDAGDPVRPGDLGRGFHGPGGAAFALELVKPFAINNSMSILDFGCGAGGPARAIVKEFDVWITGIERDRRQVELGKLLSSRPGLERKAEVIAYDHENFVSPLRRVRLHPVNRHDVPIRTARGDPGAPGEQPEDPGPADGAPTMCAADKAAPDDPLIAAALGAEHAAAVDQDRIREALQRVEVRPAGQRGHHRQIPADGPGSRSTR